MRLSEKLNNLVCEYVSDFANKQNLSCVVKQAIPIVWFGNMGKYNESPKKIVTVGLNPSLNEFSEKRFDIFDMNCVDAVSKLAETLNLYFENNPYMKWFNSFEKVLGQFDASYNEKKAENTAIHIDVYSAIATNPIWGKLSEEDKTKIQRVDLFKKLIDVLDPDIILFSANQKIFNEVFFKFKCVKNIENINGKKGFFVRKYMNDCKVLISARNYRGQPFGGISNDELKEIMKQMI